MSSIPEKPPVLTVHTIVDEASDVGEGVRCLVLKDPDDWELPPFQPGAHVDVHLPNGMVRCYSLCGDPADARRYRLGVKDEPGGRGGSRYLCSQVRVGDTLGVSLPRGGVPLPDPGERYILVAGGIGVTPFLSLIPVLQRRGLPFELHVISRGRPPFAAVLAPLVSQGLATLYDTSAGPRPALRRLLGAPRLGVRLACCGSQSLVDGFEQASADWPPQRVHIERFTAPPRTQDPTAKPYTVVLARSGKEAQASADMTVLQALRGMGVTVATSCEGGICGACKLPWLEGEPLHGDRILSNAERSRHLMACVAGCAGGRLVLDL